MQYIFGHHLNFLLYCARIYTGEMRVQFIFNVNHRVRRHCFGDCRFGHRLAYYWQNQD